MSTKPPGDDEKSPLDKLTSDEKPDFLQFRTLKVPTTLQIPITELLRTLHQTLGDIRTECSICQVPLSFCEHLRVEVRDRIIEQALQLSKKIQEGVEVYQKCRSYGVKEPSAVLNKLYRAIYDLCFLSVIIEPIEVDAEEILEEARKIAEELDSLEDDEENDDEEDKDSEDAKD